LDRWPAISELGPVPLAPGLVVEALSAPYVPRLIECIRAWYPDVVVGAESCHLRPEFYASQVALAGEEASAKDIFAMVVREQDELLAFATFERNRDARTFSGRLGAVSPRARNTKLASIGIVLQERIGRAMGAELLLNVATLRHPYTQALMEGLGFTPVGIVPAHDRDMVEAGTVKRVYEVLYAKVLVSDDAILQPSSTQMTPRVRELFERLQALRAR
jgi:hypothetical protein